MRRFMKKSMEITAAKSFMLFILYMLCLFSAVSSQVLAETGNPSASDLYGMMKWRNIGPARGGRSIAAAGVTQDSNVYFFGATGGGLWKTTDGGTTWRPTGDRFFKSASVGAIAIDQTTPDTIYVGMGEGQLRSNVLQGDGIYKSTNGGRSWVHVGLEKTRTITTIRINPKNPQIVYATALGDPFMETPERGVYRSRNGGVTWEKILFRSEKAGAIDLAMDPNNPDVLYATLWEVYRKPWKLWSGGPDSAIFKSTDGGDTWQNITDRPGLPKGVLGKMTVVVSPVDSRRVYANIEAENGGIYRSDDAGRTWEYVNSARKLWQRSFYFMQLRADPKELDTLYVLSFRLEKSKNGGKNFGPIPTRHADVHDLWIDPNDPKRMIVADDGGASVSVNGGRSWTEQDFPTAQIYRLETTNDFPYHVCGAQQDNTTICVPSLIDERSYRSKHIDSPMDFYVVGGGESGYVASHPSNPNIFFSGGTNELDRFDRQTGHHVDRQPTPEIVMGQSASTMAQRWNWTYPIVFSPLKPHPLFIGSQYVWRSDDEGLTWKKISPDLTRADPKTLGDTGGPIRFDQDGPEVYATLFVIEPSPLRKSVLWTGSDDGLVYLTKDGGNKWVDVTPPDLPVNSKITAIGASPHSEDTAFVAAKRYELGDRQPYLWVTRDSGKTWARIDQGLVFNNHIHSLAVDPVVPGALYVGTERGVFVSVDAGASWRDLSLNLPSTPVMGVEVRDNDLVIATHGRSFYVLTGLTTLRQALSNDSLTRPILYVPAQGIRGVKPAYIDYYLPEDAKDLTVEILDPSSKVIRVLIDGRRRRRGPRRLSWDMRHDGAFVFDGIILEAPNPTVGPLVAPGDYTVRLTIGESYETSASINVAKDPRLVDVSVKDMKQQEALALRARDAVTQANRAVVRISAMRTALADRLGQQSGIPKSEESKRIDDDLISLQSQLYQIRNSSPKDKIAYPIQLNDRLAAIQGFLSEGASAPTKAQEIVFEKLNTELEGHLETLGSLQQRFDDFMGQNGN
ncbi:MAG: glycosyl hydrolase [Pseudomonadota bacterium]